MTAGLTSTEAHNRVLYMQEGSNHIEEVCCVPLLLLLLTRLPTGSLVYKDTGICDKCRKDHKPMCAKFNNLCKLYRSEVVPIWFYSDFTRYLHYCLRWTRIDEFFYSAKLHREALAKRIKENNGGVHLQASWIPTPITIDGNTKHLVIYLSFPLKKTEEEDKEGMEEKPDETGKAEEFSDQEFYQALLCGTDSYENRVEIGNAFIERVKTELKDKYGISVEKIIRGVGLS